MRPPLRTAQQAQRERRRPGALSSSLPLHAASAAGLLALLVQVPERAGTARGRRTASGLAAQLTRAPAAAGPAAVGPTGVHLQSRASARSRPPASSHTAAAAAARRATTKRPTPAAGSRLLVAEVATAAADTARLGTAPALRLTPPNGVSCRAACPRRSAQSAQRTTTTARRATMHPPPSLGGTLPPAAAPPTRQ